MADWQCQKTVAAIRECKRPVTKKGLRAFLGTIGYYRKFIEKFADMSACLTPASSKDAPSKVIWSNDMDRVFRRLCESLCNHVCLCVPKRGDCYILYTDASSMGMAACLYVIREGAEVPVAFYSRQLQAAEKRYSASEREALAIVASLTHFDLYVWGEDVIVRTDHKPNLALTG